MIYGVLKKCDPDWIRTNDPQLRRLMLYPTELPDLFRVANIGHYFFSIYLTANLAFHDLIITQKTTKKTKK